MKKFLTLNDFSGEMLIAVDSIMALRADGKGTIIMLVGGQTKVIEDYEGVKALIAEAVGAWPAVHPGHTGDSA